MICTHIRVKEEGRGFNASNLGVWFVSELIREKAQNSTSAEIATLGNFPLYGNTQTFWPLDYWPCSIQEMHEFQ